MVLPLLYGLGAKDYLEPKGFLLLTCQKCQIPGPFAVFDSKRKVTLSEERRREIAAFEAGPQ